MAGMQAFEVEVPQVILPLFFHLQMISIQEKGVIDADYSRRSQRIPTGPGWVVRPKFLDVIAIKITSPVRVCRYGRSD